MKSLDQLRAEIDTLPKQELIIHLDYYRKNHLTILSINPNESERSFLAKTQILLAYGVTLINNGNFSEAYDILTKCREVFEVNPFDSIQLDQHSGYRNLLFNLGIASYRTKRNQQAKRIFEQLLELDPRNDNYREWLHGVSAERSRKLDKYFFYAFLIWLVIDVFLADSFSEPFQTHYLYFGVVLLLVSISISIYKRTKK